MCYCIWLISFFLYIYHTAGKIDHNYDVRRWLERFAEFDLDHDGFLSMKDVQSFDKLANTLNVKQLKRNRPHRQRSILDRVVDETKVITS